MLLQMGRRSVPRKSLAAFSTWKTHSTPPPGRTVAEQVEELTSTRPSTESEGVSASQGRTLAQQVEELSSTRRKLPEPDGIVSSYDNSLTRWQKFPDGARFWKPIAGTMRYQRPIFVAATKQHVGKTTTSLSLVSGLIKQFGDKVGFIKPVGQQHVPVTGANGKVLRIDKDSCLVREYFGLEHLDYEDMSPVIIPEGYTKKYVDGEVSLQDQIAAVERAMARVSAASDVVLVEGTGHCAVGSIVGLNNARTASLMGADMVLVANGGLGSAFDELELNRILCQHYNVRIAGVIINKVSKNRVLFSRDP